MRIARIKRENGPAYGLVENDRIHLCKGDPIAGLEKTGESVAYAEAKLLAPIVPPNIVCVGLNYKKHAEESNSKLPDRPLLFLKATTSLNDPEADVVLPRLEPEKVDSEAELAVVIGKTAKEIGEEEAPDYILGYTVGNDVSNKAAQRLDGQWVRGKSYDTFCPLGPTLVTDIDPNNLDIVCRIDGEVRQSSNTSDMIFTCARLVSYISHCMTLLPGTVVMTGTPEGLGCFYDPPVFLKPGQVMEVEIEGIGVLRNTIVAAK